MVVIVISIVTGLLTLFYSAAIIFLHRGWKKIPYFFSDHHTPKTSVSILIAARNEDRYIGRVIDCILNQNYPSHLVELIVIDDHSTDATSDIVLSYGSKGVKLITLNEKEKLNSYKKKAITEAIHQSAGELIITTDADCHMGPNWLNSIIAFYETGNYKIISSPVVYAEETNSFENLQTLEFLFLIGLGAAGIGNKMPSTCNGANLAYRRDVFVELKGFKGIDDLASGDDELFLHKVAAAYPQGVGFCKSRDAIVFTQAKETLSEFIQQRKRWASKSTRYKNKKIVFLGVAIWIFNSLMLVNFVGGFFNPVFWSLGAVSFAVKLVLEFIFLYSISTFAKRKSLLWYQPLLSFTHIFYFVYIGVAGNTGKYLWKGRMVR